MHVLLRLPRVVLTLSVNAPLNLATAARQVFVRVPKALALRVRERRLLWLHSNICCIGRLQTGIVQSNLEISDKQALRSSV